MRLIFVRHGESEANVAEVFSNRGWKHPLTFAGRAQSLRVAGELADRGVAAIYHSPLQRAAETAQILATRLGTPHTVDNALIEYDVGLFEGRRDPMGWIALAKVEALWDQGDLDARVPGGESCTEIRARFTPFIERLIAEHGGRELAIVAVGHGGTFRRALPAVLKNIETPYAVRHRLHYAGVIEAELRDGALWCVSWSGDRMD